MPSPRRLRGDLGMAMVTGLVLLFAFTSLWVIWLARDANRSVTNITAAQAIAFQAARSGAQQIDPGSLRDGGTTVTIDEGAAGTAARSTAAELFANYEVDGDVTAVTVRQADATVTVSVVIHDPAGDAHAVAAARAETGP